ncbi:aquaporin-like protein [Paraphaeosphaeria sporulosa]|uniref:Aquaporin-like protein n=1 Tax=Paraphaeosphaeria sporulosa TaxID=1460663 RepID=A0A177C4P1_9PLEO|nr:aquaporin-like protein [Paraphaeosphaeria sporulosa]OAG01697.1 aquaporin-like protein [Paraphaeosphaeria sporulosa]
MPREDIEAGSLRHRTRTHSEQALPIASRAFAGRIGGNQTFTISPADADFLSITAKTPDAAPLFTWRSSFALSAFATPDLWKEATIEGVGTCLQVYLAGLYAVGLSSSDAGIGRVAGVAMGSVANVFLISLFIFGAGPVSGGHFNPLITMATFMAKLAAFPRAVLYVLAQCGGAVVAGFVLRASFGGREGVGFVPGCSVDTEVVTVGEAYAFETMTAFALLFIAFGVGLDPRQKGVFGPALSPILVGLALGLCTFASGVARVGYTGASLNPARCLGLMAAGGRFDYHYIHWAGPITASVLNGIMYRVIPIYKHSKIE